MAASWIRQFDRNGYAIVRDVADTGTVDTLRAAFKDAERLQEAIQRNGAVYATRGALELAAVRQWALSDSALGLAQRILGAEARPVRGILFDECGPGACRSGRVRTVVSQSWGSPRAASRLGPRKDGYASPSSR